MSDENSNNANNNFPDPIFFQMADEFIALANEKSKEAPPDMVSASQLFAAARYNAFLLARHSQSLDELKARKEEAMKYFMHQYENMLRDNIEDHVVNFDAHRAMSAQQQ